MTNHLHEVNLKFIQVNPADHAKYELSLISMPLLRYGIITASLMKNKSFIRSSSSCDSSLILALQSLSVSLIPHSFDPGLNFL